MTLAQRLYEAGYITYMRTDSTNLSDDAVSACRNLIKKDFAPEYSRRSRFAMAPERVRRRPTRRYALGCDLAKQPALRHGAGCRATL
ncbi:MAG: hypothetical protein CM15mP84_03630 [Cellvibrionales bacterium]|nr:MAG: hypothetical protein CM15mP84_03630 [Cellvibrionales bacterium]